MSLAGIAELRANAGTAPANALPPITTPAPRPAFFRNDPRVEATRASSAVSRRASSRSNSSTSFQILKSTPRPNCGLLGFSRDQQAFAFPERSVRRSRTLPQVAGLLAAQVFGYDAWRAENQAKRRGGSA